MNVVGCQPYTPAAFTPQEKFLVLISVGDRGSTVVKALCYKSEGCATNRKVAGSIPDGVIGIFH